MTTLYNPSIKDFQCKYNGENLKIAKSMDFTSYENEVHGKHVRKHLIDFIVNERSIRHTDKQSINKVIQEITEYD